MGLLDNVRAFSKQKTEKRVWAFPQPWTPWDSFSTGGYFNQGGPVHPSQSVNTGNSVESALALPALYAGAKILAGGAASLPLKVYSTTQAGHSTRYAGPSLFDKPSVTGTTYNWVFSAIVSLVLTGNVWGLVTNRDGFGFPTGIEWIPTAFVSVQPDGDSPLNPEKSHVFVQGREVSWQGVNAEVVHVASFTVPGRLEGLSLIQLAAMTLLHGRTAQDYGTRYLQAGGQAKGTFQNNQLEVSEEMSKAVRKQLTQVMQSGEALVYGADWSYTAIDQVSAADAQLIEAMGLNAAQIAAMLDLPATRLAGTKDGAAYSSNVQEQLQILDALRPWLVCLESAFSEWLPSRRTVQFDTRAALKLDPVSQVQVWVQERAAGLKTADEIRDEQDIGPLANGTGAETMGGDLLNSMVRSAGVLPKSLANLVVPVEAPQDGPETDASPSLDQGEEDSATTRARAISDLLHGKEAA